MRCSSADATGAVQHAFAAGGLRNCNSARGHRLAAVAVRCLGLAAAVIAAFAISTSSAMALPASHNVLLIPGPGPVPADGPDGVMPTTTAVAGRPSEAFGKFNFTSLGSSPITLATLSNYDTVALIQVRTKNLSTSDRAALAQFVVNGGKLLIHDADETSRNDYTWLLPNSSSTSVGSSCNACGSTTGTSQIVANSGLMSSNPSDPAFVDLNQLQTFTDAIGDSNLLTTLDPRWFAVAKGTDALNEQGAQVAYTTSGAGLIVYNGFDTDQILPTDTSPWRCVGRPGYQCDAQTGHMTVDWLGQMWYDELNQGWGPSAGSAGGLPTTTPVASIGTPVPPSQAGLPSGKACVAKRKLFLRLRTLTRRHRGIVQIDVYVNRRHRLRERRHFHNVTLRRLPRRGKVTIKIVATTKRHYHLISRKTYHAC